MAGEIVKHLFQHCVGDDQPTTCPHCGTRTDWEPITDMTERHTCPSCKYVFIMEEGGDEEEGE